MKPRFYKHNGIKTKYLIYPNGDVQDSKSGKFLNVYQNSSGYKSVSLKIPETFSILLVHRLVAKTFIPNPENKPIVNHIDGNKLNNHYTNLEWSTPSENNKHAYLIGLHKPLSHNNVHFRIYSELQIEAACREMERDELSLFDIEKITGVKSKTLSDIRLGNIWKEISKKYTFPTNPIKVSKIGIRYDKLKILIDLAINTDLTTKQICELLDIRYKKKIKKAIHWYRYKESKLDKKMKVQRPSKTLQEILDSIPKYEEEFIFGWERSE